MLVVVHPAVQAHTLVAGCDACAPSSVSAGCDASFVVTANVTVLPSTARTCATSALETTVSGRAVYAGHAIVAWKDA